MNKDWLAYVAEEISNGKNDDAGVLHTDSTTDSPISILVTTNLVLYPTVVVPINIRDKKAIELVKSAYKDGKSIGLVAQHRPKKNDQSIPFNFGTTAKVVKTFVLHDNSITAILHGRQRFYIKSIIHRDGPVLTADISMLEEKVLDVQKKEIKALLQAIKDAAAEVLKYIPEGAEVMRSIDGMSNPSFLIYFLAANLSAEVGDRQKILETTDSRKQAKLLLKLLSEDLGILQLKHEINSKVNVDIDQKQRRYYLKQQIKTLQNELGEEDESSSNNEVAKLRDKARSKNLPQDVLEYVFKALDKAENMSPSSSEYPLTISHTDFVVNLPWNRYSKDKFDIRRAKDILDKDHDGLEKVKERILEYLAVLSLKKDLKGPILCLYGPPGVGKTSLGKSIAKALNKKYFRIALGGISDEAEIIGHRRTYIGAMPGKIMYSINKVQTSNPVLVLDEIDKLDSRAKGDPASAMLQVLDPEQNNQFVDNYLELPYDLSKVLFIATANSLDTIPYALEDRLEVIEVNGYTLEEKVQISKNHLIPKQKKEHGLKASSVRFDDTAITKIIECYTSESGVRELNRKVGSIVRKVAKAFVLGEEYSKVIDSKEVIKLLGPEIYDKDIYENVNIPGVAIGLAWTPVGGSILFIEASLAKGKGLLTLSGQLGNVMKESASLALSYVKAHADELKIDNEIFEKYDLHIHVPAGATPKDGPSAGITLLTSITSLYTNRKVKQHIAMTGEITLRGVVLPVGGIKEKILAAKRANIEHIIISKKNLKDVEEIKKEYIAGLNFHYVDNMKEVLDIALEK
jgi:ATP-dependent Lon protease